MVEATPFLPGLSSVQGKAVVSRFDGGRLSSEWSPFFFCSLPCIAPMRPSRDAEDFQETPSP